MRLASVDQQHELPAHMITLPDAMRRRNVDEREGLRDRQRKAPDSISSPVSASAWSAQSASALLNPTRAPTRH
jgi:hypothetical protein